jgi:hypothetical protein
VRSFFARRLLPWLLLPTLWPLNGFADVSIKGRRAPLLPSNENVAAVRQLAKRYVQALHDEDLNALGALFDEKVIDLESNKHRPTSRLEVLRGFRDWFVHCPFKRVKLGEVFEDGEWYVATVAQARQDYGMSLAGAGSSDFVVMIPTGQTIRRWLDRPDPLVSVDDGEKPIDLLSRCIYSDFSMLFVRPSARQWKIVGVLGLK